ncbi:hypothetical protein SARC_05215, partial [Sphaeroforma arctica JP610]
TLRASPPWVVSRRCSKLREVELLIIVNIMTMKMYFGRQMNASWGFFIAECTSKARLKRKCSDAYTMMSTCRFKMKYIVVRNKLRKHRIAAGTRSIRCNVLQKTRIDNVEYAPCRILNTL